MILAWGASLCALPARALEKRTIAAIKDDILSLSQSYLGQGDPDFTRQRVLDAFVVALLAVNPPPPVKVRFKRLAGPWHQIVPFA